MPPVSRLMQGKSKESPQVLSESERLLRAILDTAADAIITIDQRGVIRSINAATERLFGYAQTELTGQNVNRLMPEPFHREHDGYLRKYCRTGRAKIIGIGREVTGQRKDGTTFPMHLSVSEVRLKNQRLFTGIVHDLTGRRHLERQIIDAAASEQRRIGQDLHDGLCQDLIGIAFSINAIGITLPSDPVAAVDTLKKVAASVRAAAGQARDLSHGLNPVDVRAGGLLVAMQNLASKVTETFGVACTFECHGGLRVPDDATATHLYRIAQEAISNAIKHGKAKKIEIGLSEHHQILFLSVSDNGRGMSQPIKDRLKQGVAVSGRVTPQGAAAGIGLQTMQYRARVIGGTFAAEPRKGGGTIVTCTINRELRSAATRHATEGI